MHFNLFEMIGNVLKPEEEQYQKQLLEARKNLYTAKLERYRNQIDKTTDEETRKKKQKKYDAVQKTLNRTEKKLADPFTICMDYEIINSVNIDMLNFYMENVFPEEDPYLMGMLILNDTVIARGGTKQFFQSRLPNLLSMDYNTYISHCTYAHSVLPSQRNKGRGRTENYIYEAAIRGRVKETVLSTQTIAIDIDFRNIKEYNGMKAEALYNLMKSEGAFDKFGEPSFCVVTSQGSGCQFVYLLKEPYLTYLNDDRIARYEKTVKNMIRHFEKYGADYACTDINRVFRVPCSYNSKTDTYGYIMNWTNINSVERYAFEELEEKPEIKKTDVFKTCETLEEFMKDLPDGEGWTERDQKKYFTEPVKKPVKSKPKKIKDDNYCYAPEDERQTFIPVAMNRCRDLERLAELRHYDLNGIRHNFLTIYASQYAVFCQDEEKVLEAVENLNSILTEPVERKMVKIIVDNAVNKRLYVFPDVTIRQKLNITKEEIEHFQTIGHSKQNEKRKKERRTVNNQLKTKRNKDCRNKKVVELYKQGMTQKEIAEKLGITDRTVRNILKQKGKDAA